MSLDTAGDGLMAGRGYHTRAFKAEDARRIERNSLERDEYINGMRLISLAVAGQHPAQLAAMDGVEVDHG